MFASVRRRRPRILGTHPTHSETNTAQRHNYAQGGSRIYWTMVWVDDVDVRQPLAKNRRLRRFAPDASSQGFGFGVKTSTLMSLTGSAEYWSMESPRDATRHERSSPDPPTLNRFEERHITGVELPGRAQDGWILHTDLYTGNRPKDTGRAIL